MHDGFVSSHLMRRCLARTVQLMLGSDMFRKGAYLHLLHPVRDLEPPFLLAVFCAAAMLSLVLYLSVSDCGQKVVVDADAWS